MSASHEPAPFTSPLAEALAEDVLERFLRYVRVDTESRVDSGTAPSSPGQRQLAELLERELSELALTDVRILDDACVIATLPGSEAAPVIALLAHLDTSPDAPGHGVEPLVHRAWDGTPIALPRHGTVLHPERIPELRDKHGHDIVSTSGDTLLGADDKSGIAEIMAAVAHLSSHPELPRATIRVCFLSDEEIGVQGAQRVPLDLLAAHCGYTLDGSRLGELQQESFTALGAELEITGVEVHPGLAKHKMVSALRLLCDVIAALPSDRLTPETTAGREGFIHPVSIEGTVLSATARLIVRDFDDEAVERHAELLRETAERVLERHPRARMRLDVRPQYRNMGRFLSQQPEVVAAAERAMRAEGIEPVRTPIRGGTDGSILSERGLPTPNLFTGGYEHHSVREWSSLQEMAAAAAVLVRLAGVWAES